VQVIIDAVGIAKGTFYHHFRGKEEMLVALVQGLSARVVDAIAPVVADPKLDASQKLLGVARAAVAQKTADLGPESVVLIRQLRSRENRLLADCLDQIVSQWMLPFFVAIVRQGCLEGRFRVSDPELAAELVLRTLLAMKDRGFDLFLGLADGDPAALTRLTGFYAALDQAVERLLGAAEGSLPIYSSIDLRPLVARLFPGTLP